MPSGEKCVTSAPVIYEDPKKHKTSGKMFRGKLRIGAFFNPLKIARLPIQRISACLRKRVIDGYIIINMDNGK